MSIKVTFNGKTLIKPGAYSKVVVENLSGFPLAATGVVGIIGEAKGGEPGVLDILSREGIQEAKARYKEGPIADALELLVNPSRDSRIVNGASQIVVWKTNASSQSALALKNKALANMLNTKSKNFGSDENLVNLIVSEGAIPDVQAALTGTIDGPFNLAGGETLILNVSGVTYTYTNTLAGAAITTAALAADLQNGANWAPSKPVIATAEALKLRITVDSALAALDYGFVIVNPASTLDTIVGVTGSARGSKGSRILTVKKESAEEISPDLGGDSMLSLIYTGAGTSCALSIAVVSNELKLTSVCAGAAGDNLDIVLRDADGKNKFTVKSLVDFLNSKVGYTATLISANPFINADQLDFYTSIECKASAVALHRDMQVVTDHLNERSAVIEAERINNVVGAMETFSIFRFLTGAVDGASANSNFAAGFEAMKSKRINCVVPLVSRDIGAVSIASVNTLATNHAAWGWSTDGKSERSAFTSFRGSKADFKAACRAQQSGFNTMFGQEVRVLNKNSELVWLEPWAFACVAAGLRAGAEVGEPLTFKLINVNDMRVPLGDWDPKADFFEMLDAGCCIAEGLDTGGFRIVLGNTTYGVDASFVWNRESVVQAAGYIAYDLRTNLELTFTGNKARTGTATAMANFIKNRMSAYLGADIIVGDDLNEGLGYKNLRVNINGNQAIINISVTPVQGIDFILPTIYLADIRQSA